MREPLNNDKEGLTNREQTAFKALTPSFMVDVAVSGRLGLEPLRASVIDSEEDPCEILLLDLQNKLSHKDAEKMGGGGGGEREREIGF